MQTTVAFWLRRPSTTAQDIGAALARSSRSGVLGLVFLLGGALPVSAAKWDPIAPADLVAKESVSCPGADAEILRAEVSVTESGGETQTDEYIRAKIYTAKGVEEQGKFSVEYPTGARVRRPEARLVKPDGTSTELAKADYFETVSAKVAGVKWKKIAFTFPNLAPGDIIEYRWTTFQDGYLSFKWVFCQQEVPVRDYRFTIGRMAIPTYIAWMNCPGAEQKRHGDDFVVTAHNLPAFAAEQNMPPQRDFRGWVFLCSSAQSSSRKNEWKEVSASWAEQFRQATKPGSLYKKHTAQILAGATTDEEKLRRLYDFCQSEITNYSWVNTPEVQAARAQSLEDDTWSPKLILERRAGWGFEINNLFAALARSAGYEVRKINSSSRADLLNIQVPKGWLFLNRDSVGVQVGGQWRNFDPASYFVPYGMLDWREEGVVGLRCDTEKTVQLVRVPASSADRTQAQRKARLTLDDAGTLEGEIEETYTGHLAISRKTNSWNDSLEDVNKDFREEITKRLPNAEVSEVVWTNLRSRELPLIVKYHVKVPGYAEQAGTRLVFAPGFFEAGKPVVFAAAERKYPIFFSYPWGEHDDIEIVLPAGYALDKPSAPAPVGEAGKAFSANYKLQYNPKIRTFAFQRDFALGANGAFAFQVESYPLLKGYFEQLHKSDTHSILLKPKQMPATISATPATGAESN